MGPKPAQKKEVETMIKWLAIAIMLIGVVVVAVPFTIYFFKLAALMDPLLGYGLIVVGVIIVFVGISFLELFRR